MPAAQQPGYLSPQLAWLLLDDRTQVGDVVWKVEDDVALAATAASIGRYGHALGGAHIGLVLLRWPRPGHQPAHRFADLGIEAAGDE
jgi:hypothetical protein